MSLLTLDGSRSAVSCGGAGLSCFSISVMMPRTSASLIAGGVLMSSEPRPPARRPTSRTRAKLRRDMTVPKTPVRRAAGKTTSRTISMAAPGKSNSVERFGRCGYAEAVLSAQGDRVMTEPASAGLEPFHGLEINALARRLEAQGRDIAFLEQGQPAAPPAPAVIEAVRQVLDGPQMYTHFAGMPALRQRLAQYYAEQHGVTVPPDSIVATMGSSSGFILAFLGGFAPHAKIAVTQPGYTAYLNTLYGMGYRPVEIPVSAAEGWHLTPDAIRAAHAREPFAGLLLASPANPTGAAVTRTQLADIVAVCAELGVRFISDEIYHGLDYRGPSVSALEFTRDAIVINSFSKYYCMTGWRIG